MLSDAAYAAWRAAPGADTEGELYTAMRQQANAILWKMPAYPGDEGQDVVAEALGTAFTKLASFRGEAAFSTWFYRVVVNCYNQWMRKFMNSRRNLEFGLDTLIEEPATALQADPGIMLEQLREHLTAREQTMLDARLEGEDWESIGASLSIRPDYARFMWTRLRRKLIEHSRKA